MPITLKERPIIMIGAERSGTTLVMAMLGCHPRIAVPEVVWYYPRFRPLLHLRRPFQSANLRTLAEEMVFGLKDPVLGNEGQSAHDPRRDSRGPQGTQLRRNLLRDARALCAQRRQQAPLGREDAAQPVLREGDPRGLPERAVHLHHGDRDASADYLDSAFGPTNIFCAAESWALCQNAVKPWRKLRADQWMDLRYEELVKDPVGVLKTACKFLGEDFAPQMLEFYKTELAKNRGATKDHKPLGHETSDRYIGIYKRQLSVRDQGIFAAVAGKGWKRRATRWTCSRRRSPKSRSRCGASSTDVLAPPPWTRPRAMSCTRATTTGSSINAESAPASGRTPMCRRTSSRSGTRTRR